MLDDFTSRRRSVQHAETHKFSRPLLIADKSILVKLMIMTQLVWQQENLSKANDNYSDSHTGSHYFDLWSIFLAQSISNIDSTVASEDPKKKNWLQISVREQFKNLIQFLFSGWANSATLCVVYFILSFLYVRLSGIARICFNFALKQSGHVQILIFWLSPESK